jgi:hypothetical protein
MRFSWIVPVLAIASTTLALSPKDELPAKRAAGPSDPASTESPEPKGTVFNGLDVPPMIELSGEKLSETIAKGNWYVHHNCFVTVLAL